MDWKFELLSGPTSIFALLFILVLSRTMKALGSRTAYSLSHLYGISCSSLNAFFGSRNLASVVMGENLELFGNAAKISRYWGYALAIQTVAEILIFVFAVPKSLKIFVYTTKLNDVPASFGEAIVNMMSDYSDGIFMLSVVFYIVTIGLIYSFRMVLSLALIPAFEGELQITLNPRFIP